MASKTDLLLDALSAAAAAVVTHLVVERLDLPARARRAVPRRLTGGRRPRIDASGLAQGVVAMLVFRGAAGGARRVLQRVI